MSVREYQTGRRECLTVSAIYVNLTFSSVSKRRLLRPRDGSSSECESLGGVGATRDMGGLTLSMGRTSDASSTETVWNAFVRRRAGS